MFLYFLIFLFITWILCLSEQQKQNTVSLIRGKSENNPANSTTQKLPQKGKAIKFERRRGFQKCQFPSAMAGRVAWPGGSSIIL